MKSKYFLLANEPFVRTHIKLSRRSVFFSYRDTAKNPNLSASLFAPQRNLDKSPNFRQTQDLINK